MPPLLSAGRVAANIVCFIHKIRLTCTHVIEFTIDCASRYIKYLFPKQGHGRVRTAARRAHTAAARGCQIASWSPRAWPLHDICHYVARQEWWTGSLCTPWRCTHPSDSKRFDKRRPRSVIMQCQRDRDPAHVARRALTRCDSCSTFCLSAPILPTNSQLVYLIITYFILAGANSLYNNTLVKDSHRLRLPQN